MNQDARAGEPQPGSLPGRPRVPLQPGFVIKNLLRRGLPALALTALPLLISTAPAAQAVPAGPGAVAVRTPLSLFAAIDQL